MGMKRRGFVFGLLTAGAATVAHFATPVAVRAYVGNEKAMTKKFDITVYTHAKPYIDSLTNVLEQDAPKLKGPILEAIRGSIRTFITRECGNENLIVDAKPGRVGFWLPGYDIKVVWKHNSKRVIVGFVKLGPMGRMNGFRGCPGFNILKEDIVNETTNHVVETVGVPFMQRTLGTPAPRAREILRKMIDEAMKKVVA